MPTTPPKTPEPQKPLDWNAFKEFVEEFKNESDRAAVILGAAKLDALLGQILDRFLLPCTSSTDELLEGDSPLATFSARINICHRLGLISPQFAKSLHLVRRIRNGFAHELAGCSLNSGSHSDRLKSLLAPLRPLPFYRRFHDRFFDKMTPSTEFKACLAMMAARLETRASATTQVLAEKVWNFPQSSWADPSTGTVSAPSTEPGSAAET